MDVIGATVQRRTELETVADHAHEDIGLPFLRPIALIKRNHTLKPRKHTQLIKLKRS